MAERILILGRSNSGKTTSLRNLDPEKTLVIQAVKKRLPFPHKDWKLWDKASATGSIFITSDIDAMKVVLSKMSEVGKEVVVIDDANYALMNRVLDDRDITGFAKWTELGANFQSLLSHIDSLNENMRVYIMAHTEVEDGFTVFKAPGKLIKEKLGVEGMSTIVLGATRSSDSAHFTTNGSTLDPYKSPMGMFKDKEVPNDLAIVDKIICDFYSIPTKMKNKTD